MHGSSAQPTASGPEIDASHPLLIEHVSYRYQPDQPDAVRDVSLTVEQRSIVGVLGPNGGGKSTLVRLALGDLEPDAGEVRVAGIEPVAARREGLIGYVSQERPPVAGVPMSVGDFLRYSLSAHLTGFERMSSTLRDRLHWAMDVTGASAFQERPVGALSGGQLQRVVLARAIAMEPALLLLDEPTVGVDVQGQAAFAELLETVRDRTGCGLLLVSHDLRAMVAGCDQIACLNQTLHAHVAPDGLTPSVLAEVFAHEVEGALGAVHVEAHLAAGCAHEHHGPADAPCGEGSSTDDSESGRTGP